MISYDSIAEAKERIMAVLLDPAHKKRDKEGRRMVFFKNIYGREKELSPIFKLAGDDLMRSTGCWIVRKFHSTGFHVAIITSPERPTPHVSYATCPNCVSIKPPKIVYVTDGKFKFECHECNWEMPIEEELII